jgi:hypothetical protein
VIRSYVARIFVVICCFRERKLIYFASLMYCFATQKFCRVAIHEMFYLLLLIFEQHFGIILFVLNVNNIDICQANRALHAFSFIVIF